MSDNKQDYQSDEIEYRRKRRRDRIETIVIFGVFVPGVIALNVAFAYGWIQR